MWTEGNEAVWIRRWTTCHIEEDNSLTGCVTCTCYGRADQHTAIEESICGPRAPEHTQWHKVTNIIQGDQKVSVHLMITIQSSGAHRLFDHPVYQVHTTSIGNQTSLLLHQPNAPYLFVTYIWKWKRNLYEVVFGVLLFMDQKHGPYEKMKRGS